MTKRREWPNAAIDARDRSAEAAVEGIRLLEPLLFDERPRTESDRLQREARALALFQRIARLLESVGAQTQP